jgi:GTP-binding protein YchF
MEILDRAIDRTKIAAKGDASLKDTVELYERIRKALDEGKCVRAVELDEEEKEKISGIGLLSGKSVIYAANISEKDIPSPESNPYFAKLASHAASEGAEIVAVCASAEADIAQLDEDERQLFLEDLGLTASGLDRLIKSSYKLLGLISFLTAGSDEVRAWTIKNGTKAPGAAGKIHSDFERGFIRAETVAFDVLVDKGSMTAAKEAGLVKSEGKEYIVKDGDIMLFRFNV